MINHSNCTIWNITVKIPSYFALSFKVWPVVHTSDSSLSVMVKILIFWVGTIFVGEVRRYNFVVFEQVALPLNLLSFRSYMTQHLVDDGAVDPLLLIQTFEGHV